MHALTLSAAGVQIYPQLEERVAAAARDDDGPTPRSDTAAVPSDGAVVSARLLRCSFGLPALDELIGGGIPQGTSTVLAGSLGVGKTLLALHFALAGIAAGERMVYLSLRESRAQLRQTTAGLTLDAPLLAALAAGTLHFLALLPIKVEPDILADRLIGVLAEVQPQRLIVDSITEIEDAVSTSPAPARLREDLAALLHLLNQQGVTTLFLKEIRQAVAATLDFSAEPLEVLAENVLLAQQVTAQGQLHRIISVLKLRYSAHDTALREFTIATPAGIVVQPDQASLFLRHLADEQETQRREE